MINSVDVERCEIKYALFIAKDNTVDISATFMYNGERIGGLTVMFSPKLHYFRRPNLAWIVGISIKEEWQNKGLGSFFIGLVLEELPTIAERLWMGDYTPFLEVGLDVLGSNKRAIHVYEKLGFTFYRNERRHNVGMYEMVYRYNKEK